MEERIADALTRLSAVERAQLISDRNQSDISKTLTHIIEEHATSRAVLNQLRTDKAVREERDKALDARLTGIEKSIDKIYKLGWWFLTAALGALVLAAVKFLVAGGFNV